jgi:ankyrin repeat protein
MDQPTDNTTEDITAAAMWGDVALLENFLANGADPNTRNSQGNTALHVACYYGERECASVLLNYKAEVNARGVDGKTPLHRAVLGVLVLEPGVKYSTHKQIEDNQIDLVKLLVGRGGKVSLADVSGDTPFDLAIQCDFYDCADLLTELGKDEEKMAIEQEFYQKIDGK